MTLTLPRAVRMPGTAPFFDFATLRGLAVGWRFAVGDGMAQVYEVTAISPGSVGDGAIGVLVEPVIGIKSRGEAFTAYLSADGGPTSEEDD